MSDSAPVLTSGLVVTGTYEVDRLLGRGGMGEVWLARHLRLAGKQVAIKILHVQGDVTNEALARFRREAEIAARLEHPNIVQVLDFNALPSGQPFLVMEYLKGQSLSDRIKAGPLSLEQIHYIVRQIGAALQTAHAAGVVHRDLKPENIYLVPTALGDQVKVLDFGISKLADSKSLQTSDSVLIGTPLYMSPEQALGNNSAVDSQSDIFSLGSICYEMFTGQAPFFADNLARVVFRIAYERHVPLGEAAPQLPVSAVQAVEHALEKEKHNRTPTVDAFVAELTGLPLAAHVEHAQSESSGVYTPGMPLSASLLEGKTFDHSRKATPLGASAPKAPGPSKAADVETRVAPSTVSGKLVAIALVVSSVVLAAGVISLRLWWQRLPTPSVAGQGAADAGVAATVVTTVVPAVTAADAGLAAAVVTPPEPAGVPDAAAHVDAGAPRTRVEAVVADVPATESDKRLLTALQKATREEDWLGLENKRASVMTIQNRKVRAEALGLVIQGLCMRAANNYIMPPIEELNRVASPAQRKQVREKCIAVYPSAQALGW